MTTDKIIYYLDCYYRLIDYGEALSDIIADFTKDETETSIQEFISQCEAVLALPKEAKYKQLHLILKKATDLEVTVREVEEILQETIVMLCE